MPAGIKTKFTDKKSGKDVELQEYEYDFTNSEGKKFHVKVHREITRLSPEKQLEKEV